MTKRRRAQITPVASMGAALSLMTSISDAKIVLLVTKVIGVKISSSLVIVLRVFVRVEVNEVLPFLLEDKSIYCCSRYKDLFLFVQARMYRRIHKCN